ncbi:hypothetical protein EVAR_69817_1 [Eumeta japonica]|uniref:Uncharacterized protein n=1 Tax=Eumeta variegata TaxID=151549 RepID=A0A4C1Z7L7_EUMVA|nr:hypothetical protein EVAR_69817_1 [Eumeta japonica]
MTVGLPTADGSCSGTSDSGARYGGLRVRTNCKYETSAPGSRSARFREISLPSSYSRSYYAESSRSGEYTFKAPLNFGNIVKIIFESRGARRRRNWMPLPDMAFSVDYPLGQDRGSPVTNGPKISKEFCVGKNLAYTHNQCLNGYFPLLRQKRNL